MTQTGPHTHSPYRRGADDGFVFGAYLTASFLTMVWSSAVPLLGLVSMLLLAGVPVFIYMRLRRSFVADCGHTLLSSLWMQGIATFACGSLIAGAVATAYLKWIEPDFIIGRLREAIDFYSGSGWERGQEVADTLQRMIDMHLVPSAVAIVVELIWLAIFSGSLVSLLMALLARSRPSGPNSNQSSPNYSPPMDISVIIPLYNEAESLPELEQWIARVMADNGFSYEILFINDGSTDDSWDVIRRLAESNPAVKGVSFRRNYGKSPALNTGFVRAQGDVVITMDADLQDSPDEIPVLYDMIKNEGYDLVSGWKQKRYDPLSKTIPTKLFNATARRVSGIKNLHDFNCGLKAYRNKVVKHIEVYGDMHRYIPYLAKNAGFTRIGEKVVHHQARKYGKTKFGLDRFVNGYLDLATLWFTNKFGVKPMHFFGLLGSLMFILGFVAAAAVGIIKLYHMHTGQSYSLVTDSPYFYISLVMMILGTQLFLTGFLGELIVRNSPRRNDYEIEEELRTEKR